MAGAGGFIGMGGTGGTGGAGGKEGAGGTADADGGVVSGPAAADAVPSDGADGEGGFNTTISTRRFCARPCRVSFDATGFDWPYPTAEMRFGETPCSITALRTLSARASDSCRLKALPPTLSVWPSTMILRSE